MDNYQVDRTGVGMEPLDTTSRRDEEPKPLPFQVGSWTVSQSPMYLLTDSPSLSPKMEVESGRGALLQCMQSALGQDTTVSLNDSGDMQPSKMARIVIEAWG